MTWQYPDVFILLEIDIPNYISYNKIKVRNNFTIYFEKLKDIFVPKRRNGMFADKAL